MIGGAAITVAVFLAPSASADPLFSANENQHTGTLYSNNIQPKPGDTTTNLIAHGYWVCNVLGNHSGGYVASQIWQASNMTPNGVTYSQAKHDRLRRDCQLMSLEVVLMKRLVIGGLAALAIGLTGAPVAGADCCETEFDWAIPYIEALENHGLGRLVNDLGIPVALAAEDVCQGASQYDIDSDYELSLAQAEKIAEATYDVCPEMAR